MKATFDGNFMDVSYIYIHAYIFILLWASVLKATVNF